MAFISVMQIATLLLTDGAAHSFSACRFQIKGAEIVSDSCEVSALGVDGYYVSFDTEYVFMYLLRDETEGYRGYWNEYESHAHTPIGMLSVDGNCWSGETARLCLK
jgi:hypothetical protein